MKDAAKSLARRHESEGRGFEFKCRQMSLSYEIYVKEYLYSNLLVEY